MFHLNDIIVHALRNAVIHGIETTEDRAKSGKKPHGRIKLKSYVDGDMICISVEDDGVGLNVDKIKESLIT